jgi:hypothetical protein
MMHLSHTLTKALNCAKNLHLKLRGQMQQNAHGIRLKVTVIDGAKWHRSWLKSHDGAGGGSKLRIQEASIITPAILWLVGRYRSDLGSHLLNVLVAKRQGSLIVCLHDPLPILSETRKSLSSKAEVLVRSKLT